MFRARHPEVPWSGIVGMRNHLVHGYFAIDTDLLRIAVTVEIPGLATTVRSWFDE
jgi:uncharacterized protein with HEPN domain